MPYTEVNLAGGSVRSWYYTASVPGGFFFASLYGKLYLDLISRCLYQLGFIFLFKLYEVLLRKQLILFKI
jgi:hypothetical protein